MMFALSIVQAQSTPNQNPSPNPSPWPDNFFSRISQGLNDDWVDQTTRLSASLFNEIADLELFSIGSDSVEVAPRIHRRVFDNRDLLETFSVADTFRLPVRVGLWNEQEIPFPRANLNAGLGIELFFQGLNIRQVSAKSLSELELPPQDIENRLRNLRRARYGQWWNPIMIPLRLPLTQKALDKMDKGEISSWLLGGTLRLDGSFGWGDLGVMGADFLEISSGITTYLSGTFRVSALKLEDQKIRLKVARENNRGIAVNLGQSRMDYTLFEGFMVFDKNILSLQESVIPFSFQTSWEIAKGFDVVYDFDLTKEEAKRAYFLAAQGRLKLSHQLAKQKDSGVTHVIDREYESRRRLTRSQMKLSLIFQKQSAESWSLTRAKITTPEKQYVIFESQNTNVRGYDSLWGSAEERRYQLTASLDKDGTWINRPRVLDLRVDISDSDMSGRELNQILNEVRELSGMELDLPNFPERIPCRRCSSQGTRMAWYGSGKASVHMELSGQDLKSFVATDEEEYWPLLESAYGTAQGEWSLRSKRFWWAIERLILTTGNMPLYLVDSHMKAGGKMWSAIRLRRHWRRAAKAYNKSDNEKLAFRLGRIFKQRYYNRELTRLIMLTAKPTQETPTVVDLSMPDAFGRLRKVSGDFPSDDLARRIQRELDFDIPGPRQDFDPAMNFKEAKIERREDGSIELKFTLEKVAKYLHWHVEKRQSFSRRTTLLKRMMPLIDETFGPGEVRFVITADHENPLFRQIHESLSEPVPLAIRLSASQDGSYWGEISELHLDAKE